MYLTETEISAVHASWDYLNGLLEQCSADEDTEDGERVVTDLRNAMAGLWRILDKARSDEESKRVKRVYKMALKLVEKKNKKT